MGSEQFLKIENTLFTAVMLLYLAAMVLYFIFLVIKHVKAGKIAGYVMVIGFVLHTAALVTRGIDACAEKQLAGNPRVHCHTFLWCIRRIFCSFFDVSDEAEDERQCVLAGTHSGRAEA